MNNIKAWYAVNVTAGNFGNVEEKAVVLNVTHKLLPVAFSDGEGLVVVFDLYNWVQSGFKAPEIVNEFARDNDSHCSMSVGDIAEIDDKFYICLPVGWKEINPVRNIELPDSKKFA